ncbi:MAG: hypothetical protein J6S00_03660, partial [Clostridia bacterium]|nr:hypothetical protein [Clostridia bacterium]
ITVDVAGKETVELTRSSDTTGTVGMIYKGCDFDLHRFKVTHSLENAIYAPVRVIEEEPEEVEITESINLGVNEVYNLANATLVFKGNTVAGSAVEWTVPNNNAYELNGTKLYTFAEADFYAVAEYKGVEKKIAVSIKNEYNGTNEDAVDMLASLDNGSLSITKYGYGKYVLTVNANDGYILKAGSLKVNVGGKTINVTSRTNTAGTEFGFAAESIDGAVIGAEFVKENTADVVMLGGSIRLATETVTSGIRFGGRINNIKSAKLADTIVIDGKEYNTLGVGTLLLPSVLLDGELTVDTESVANATIKSLVDATENYADVAVTLTGIPEGKMRDVKISARTYVMYEDENGATQYYYSDVVERSYNEVYGIVYPTVENAGAIDEIITVENEKTAGLDKDFAFNVTVNGRYTVNYVINDKDGNQVAGGVISSLDAYNQHVKVGALGQKAGTYQLIVTVKDVDLADRNDTTDLVGTYTIQVYDEEILISDTQKYLNTKSYEYGNKKGADTTYLKFTMMSDQHYAWSSYGDGNNSYMTSRR